MNLGFKRTMRAGVALAAGCAVLTGGVANAQYYS